MGTERINVEPGPILILVLGLAILAAGIVRFLHLGHFTLSQAVYCLISFPAALLLLLITDYTLHHARIVFVMVVVILTLLAIGSPSFCVGLGVGLTGIVLTQWRG
jgi:hypothetical protein